MFCPKCGLSQSSEDLRFCPRCGMRLAAVKELVGHEETRAGDSAQAGGDVLPRQKDINLGAFLMLAGGVASVLWGFTGPQRGPAEIILPQAYAALGFTLAFILLLFHPLLGALQKLFSGGAGHAHGDTPKRREGINLGALLMFVGTLKAILLTYAMPPGGGRAVTTLFIMALMFAVLLFLRPILKGVHALLFKEATHAADSAPPFDEGSTARLDSRQGGAALPPARAVPVNQFTHPRANTAELVAPPSVTEDATRKLDN